MSVPQMPNRSKSPAQNAAGMLAFLLSVIRCKESLSPEEEAVVKYAIADLGVDPAASNDRRIALVLSLDDLRQRLHLPETSQVLGANVNFDAGCVEIFVSDPSLRLVGPGCHAPRVSMRHLNLYPSHLHDPDVRG